MLRKTTYLHLKGTHLNDRSPLRIQVGIFEIYDGLSIGIPTKLNMMVVVTSFKGQRGVGVVRTITLTKITVDKTTHESS